MAKQIQRHRMGTAGSAGQQLAWNPQTGAPFWQKRRYILVDDYTDTGGTVQDALNAVPTAGGEVVFRGDGAYTVPNAGLTISRNNMRIVSSGSRAAKLTAPATATSAAVLSSSGYTGLRIEGLEIDCNNHATMVRGLSITHNTNIFRDIELHDVTVRNALARGIWFWKAGGIRAEGVKVHDSVIGILVDDVSGMVRIRDPYIVNTVAGRMQYGIQVTAGGSRDTQGVVIDAPFIKGADYASPNGAHAHGINVQRCQGVQVVAPEITACGNPANGQGGAIVFGVESEFGQVIGGHLYDLHAVGIWQEVVPSGGITLGSDTIRRGVSARGTRIERATVGVSTSYGAGSVLEDVWALECEREGFITDAENVTYIGCRAVNCWSDTSAPGPIQNNGAKAGFRAYGNTGDGTRNEYSGAYTACTSIDNRTVQLQEYGFAVEDRGYRFVGNVGEGTLGAYTGGTTNNKFAANSW